MNYLEFQGKYTLLRNSLVCFETLNQKPNLFYIVHNHVGNIFQVKKKIQLTLKAEGISYSRTYELHYCTDKITKFGLCFI